MKKSFLTLTLLTLSLVAFTSCRDKKETKKVIKVEKEKEAPEEDEGILERSAKKVDEKINKEVDEEIDKIDDDN